MIDGPWCYWLILFFPARTALVTSAEKWFQRQRELLHFYERLWKQTFVCFSRRITCTDERCTISPGTCIKKTRVIFDFTSSLIVHVLIYPSWLAAERLIELWEREKTSLVLSFTQHTCLAQFCTSLLRCCFIRMYQHNANQDEKHLGSITGAKCVIMSDLQIPFSGVYNDLHNYKP